MIPALAAVLAIVVQDHAAMRAAPRSDAVELAALWQGDLLEVRGEGAGYLKVYDHRRERGGYLRSETARRIDLTAADAPGLLAVLRFLRDSPGSEALGIGYGAAYLMAAPPTALTAEPLDAIGAMAERLADRASGIGTGTGADASNIAAHLMVVEQFGIRMHGFERAGRMQVCYDGELFRRALMLPGATDEQRARAALGLTRPDCIDPDLGPVPRAELDDERRRLLATVADRDLSAMTRAELHLRCAGVWAAIAFGQARRGGPATEAAQQALAELLAVHPEDLGDDRRSKYLDAVVRVGAVRWAAADAGAGPSSAPQAAQARAARTDQAPVTQTAPLTLRATPGDPGQTCLELNRADRRDGPLARRCTYGVTWLASARSIAQGRALVLAVQPAECWRELWVFHQRSGHWTIDVLPPGLDEPEEGYIEFAGYAPGTRRLLIARELKERGHFRRRFEELRLDDLVPVHQATFPELLPDFGRWQDPAWRRDTLALH